MMYPVPVFTLTLCTLWRDALTPHPPPGARVTRPATREAGTSAVRAAGAPQVAQSGVSCVQEAFRVSRVPRTPCPGAPAHCRHAPLHPPGRGSGHLVARGSCRLLSLVFVCRVGGLSPTVAVQSGSLMEQDLDPVGLRFFSCSVRCVSVSIVWRVVGLWGILGLSCR